MQVRAFERYIPLKTDALQRVNSATIAKSGTVLVCVVDVRM